jgi:DNA polymerase (family X)
MTTQSLTNQRQATWSNRQVAEALEEVAQLLKGQAANPFRIAAYRAAAGTLRSLNRPVADIVESEGQDGLRSLPGIGVSLAHSIEELVRTGRLELLGRLRDQQQADNELTSLPGVGDELADRIRQTLGINTLEELEGAAYDGRLGAVPGIGCKRIRAIRESLSLRLGRGPEVVRSRRVPPPDEPSVGELLEVDRLYRQRAATGRLPRTAPHRFNPTGAAWLPILHLERGGRHYTAMFSNSAKAHEEQHLHDWVVIYRDDDKGYGQWTVITSRFGPLRGRRIVRGREVECREHYRQQLAQQLLQLEAPEQHDESSTVVR